MEDVYVIWQQPPAQPADGEESSHPVHHATRQGRLTIDPDEVDGPEPVLVEEESERVYHAADLPAETVLYIEAAPRELPPMAEAAREAGFRIERADETGPEAD